MAVWVYMTTASGNMDIIDLNDDYQVLCSVNNKIRFWVDGELYVTSSFDVNVWTHVVTTIDGSMSYLYKNGAQIWSGAHALPTEHGTTCSFGWPGSGWDLYAYLDDVYLYDRALTAAEVLIVMSLNP